MAEIGDDSVSEDQWLYGDSNPDQQTENDESARTIDDASRIIDPFINPDAPTGGEPQVNSQLGL